MVSVNLLLVFRIFKFLWGIIVTSLRSGYSPDPNRGGNPDVSRAAYTADNAGGLR